MTEFVADMIKEAAENAYLTEAAKESLLRRLLQKLEGTESLLLLSIP